MEIEEIEKNTKIIERCANLIQEHKEVIRVLMFYIEGASAESCMERIKRIILGEIDD